MAIREIRTEGDPVLRKNSKTVTKITRRISELIDDLYDTMYDANGCGLAAVQVGILKKIFVVDCGGEEERVPITFINPEILEADGSEEDTEGCLSVPGYQGKVTRASKIKVRFMNEDFEECELEAEGLLARCIQHENDHLYGILYTDKVDGELQEVKAENAKN